MRQALVEGKPLDPKTFTVLNANNLMDSSNAAVGGWRDAHVRMLSMIPGYSFARLRARASVGVDVPKV
jgi:hypothetical protein